jgi:Histidine kinase-, DNA gyrase B-, and HSP90-like ATPase
MPQMMPFLPTVCDWYALLRTFTRDVAIPPKHLIGEMVDNSLDAGAKRIEIVIDLSKDLISVRDDGNGAKSLADCFRLGDSGKNLADLGRYGVGLKTAGFHLGSQIALETQHAGCRQYAFSDLDEELCELSQRERSPGASFFKVVIGHLKKKRQKWEPLAHQLAEIYEPALRAGKKIVLNGSPIPVLAYPRLTHRIEVERTYNGLPFRAFGGVMKDDSRSYGYHLVLPQRRVISINNNDGMGRYSGSRFFAWVELLEDQGRWPIDKNKRGLMDEDEFVGSLFPDFEPAIRAASDQVREIRMEDQSDRFAKAMEDVWDNVLGKTKRVRGDGSSIQGRGPGGRGFGAGGSGTSAAEVPADDGKQRKGGAWRVYISVTNQAPSTRLGQAKISNKEIRVIFNRNSRPYQILEENKKSYELLSNLEALKLIALALAGRLDPQMPLRFDEDEADDIASMDFVERYYYYADTLQNHYLKVAKTATAA